MSKFNSEIEPHEILLDKLTKKKEEEIGVSEKKIETPIFTKNLLILFIFPFVFFSIFFFRVFYLQIIEGKKFLKLAESNKFINAKIQAERGIIYDKNLNPLVLNFPRFDLVFNREKFSQDLKPTKEIIEKLSYILNIDQKDIEEKLNSSEKKIKIKENLDRQALIVLNARIEEFPGFEIESFSQRKYIDSQIFSHILGYLGKIEPEEIKAEPNFYSIFDFVGREGIEKSYEKTLRKNPGEIRIERDARGNIISKETVSLPTSGKNVVLFLDSDLQKKLTEELEKKIKEVGAKGGAAIAMDPRTGGILAMVSLPSFDSNEPIEKYLKNPKNPLFNRATSGQYLLGSTIKPFIALAALEEKIISPSQQINCEGKIEIPHRYDPEKLFTFGDWTIHGFVDLKKAIAESCNVYFYTIGGGYKNQKGLGPTRIKKYLELFGFGKIPDVDFPIPSFAQGILPDPDWKKQNIREAWWDGDTYNLSIGQGYILATPLQVVQAFSAIANGGKLLKPRFVWKIIDSEKRVIKEFEPEIERENFLDSKNLEVVKEGMRWAVSGQNSPYASAVLLNTLPVPAAAKTGTAQVFRKGCENCYNIWISVFAPYEDPKIVLTIVLEDVRGVLSGVVVPVAKEVLNWYFTR